MTRRPASRRPPKLPADREARLGPADPVAPREIGPRELLKRNRVSGCAHPKFGRAEIRERARRLVAGDPHLAHGLELGAPDVDDVYAALTNHWGCTLDDPRARLDVDLTITNFDRACAQVDEVAMAGGRLIFATSRPASLLPLHLLLARDAEARGARALREREATGVRAGGRSDRALWWIDQVAVLTDGSAVLGHDDHAVWPEVDFALGRAELVVADGALAAGAVAAGFDVVAFADLDSMALGLVCDRGLPVTVVPIVCSRPAWCYEPLAELASLETRSTSPVL